MYIIQKLTSFICEMPYACVTIINYYFLKPHIALAMPKVILIANKN